MDKKIEDVTLSVTQQLAAGKIRPRDIGSIKIENENEIHVATKFHPPRFLVLNFDSASDAKTGQKIITDLTRGDANLGVKPKTLAGGPALTPTGAWI